MNRFNGLIAAVTRPYRPRDEGDVEPPFDVQAFAADPQNYVAERTRQILAGHLNWNRQPLPPVTDRPFDAHEYAVRPETYATLKYRQLLRKHLGRLVLLSLQSHPDS